MLISTIFLDEHPSGEKSLRCPQCKSSWVLPGGSELTPCSCIQFLWGSSELGEAKLKYVGDFDGTELENAYRERHWIVHQDDDIIDGDLGAPDPYVLEQLAVAGVDEAIFLISGLDPDTLNPAAICIGSKVVKSKGRARNYPGRRKGYVYATMFLFPREKAPDWASCFLGRRFLIDSAGPIGWVDQNSECTHFGVPAGPGIWLFKLGQTGEQPCCPSGRNWWRFLLVKLSTEGRIRTIYTRVDEIFPDGTGEFCTHDLLPTDIAEALEALEAAAPEGIPAVTIN